MPQGILAFKYVEEKKSKNFTGLSGLLLYLELFKLLGLDNIISRNIQIKKESQGWRDEQIIICLILLNLAGGECIDDIEKLEHNEGFCRILKHIELRGENKCERKKIRRRWRKQKVNTIASPSAMFRYLSNFHNEAEEKKRESGKAFIPAMNDNLNKISDINLELVDFHQRHNYKSRATIDIDATLIPTLKSNALYAYKDGKAYQHKCLVGRAGTLVLHTEFRDGNVPAGHEVLRVP